MLQISIKVFIHSNRKICHKYSHLNFQHYCNQTLKPARVNNESKIDKNYDTSKKISFRKEINKENSIDVGPKIESDVNTKTQLEIKELQKDKEKSINQENHPIQTEDMINDFAYMAEHDTRAHRHWYVEKINSGSQQKQQNENSAQQKNDDILEKTNLEETEKINNQKTVNNKKSWW